MCKYQVACDVFAIGLLSIPATQMKFAVGNGYNVVGYFCIRQIAVGKH